MATLDLRLAVGLVVVSAAFPNLSTAEDQTKLRASGQAIAEQHCARCHVVGSKNPFGGISSTPSFSLLVNHLPDWQERFETFPARLPHPSIIRFKGDAVDPNLPVLTVPIELEYEDIAALSAYAQSLRKP